MNRIQRVLPAVVGLALAVCGNLGSLELAFRIIGIEPDRGGTINVGLYDSEDGFPETGFEVAGLILPVDGDTAEGAFTDLPRGNYVLAVLHDEDGDNVMRSRGSFGMPDEGYGFSNTDKARLRPPKFDKAAVELSTANRSVDVLLRYP